MIFNITKGIACSRPFNLLGRMLLFHITIASDSDKTIPQTERLLRYPLAMAM
ncbi:MAG: hypothetical protein KGI30_07835 [Planctomycetota bacterium]|nr:hypothetical protein [Planctomycetota bacterium]